MAKLQTGSSHPYSLALVRVPSVLPLPLHTFYLDGNPDNPFQSFLASLSPMNIPTSNQMAPQMARLISNRMVTVLQLPTTQSQSRYC